LDFLEGFSKNIHRKNLMKIRPVGAKLLHADGQTSSRFSQFFQRAYELKRKNNKFQNQHQESRVVMKPNSLRMIEIAVGLTTSTSVKLAKRCTG
jgi:hypothetical protein